MTELSIDRITVGPDSSILDAFAGVEHGGVGLCIVAEQGRFLGILTDGDLRRALLSGADARDSIADFINRDPLVSGPSEPRAGVLDMIQARGLTAMPIVDGGRVVGVHTLRTLVGAARRPNRAVVMAGGRGSRLGTITESVPKPMLAVAGRPLLERIVLNLVGSGIREISISVNYRREVIEEHFGDGEAFGCSITYLRETPDEPLGTAGSLGLIESVNGREDHPILVVNGDVLHHAPLGGLLDQHRVSGAALTVAATDHEYEVPFGVLVHEAGRLVAIEEKPAKTWVVGAGINVVDPGLLQLIPDGRFDMTDLYELALSRGLPVHLAPLEGSWIDVGRPADLSRARGEA